MKKERKVTYLVTLEVKTSTDISEKHILRMLREDPPHKDVFGAGRFGNGKNEERGVYSIKTGRVVSIVPKEPK